MKPRAVIAWGISTSFVLFQFFLQAASGIMADQWARDLSIGPSQIGHLSAAFFYAYVILQIPVGLSYDRYGARNVLLCASMLLSIGCIFFSISGNFSQALLARMMMGAGSAFGFVGMLYVTSSSFSPRLFALFVGLSETIAMLGVAIGEMGLSSVISFWGWRACMGFAGLLSLFIFVCIFWFIEKPNPKSTVSRFKIPLLQALKKALSHQQVWLAGLYGFSMMSLVNVFASLWGFPYLKANYPEFQLHAIAFLISLVFIGVALGGPLNAWLSNALGSRRLIIISFNALTLLCTMTMLLVPHMSFKLLVLLIFFAGLFSSSYIQSFAVVKESVPAEIRATSLSAMNMILMANAPVLQPMIGWMIEHGLSYTAAMLLLPALMAIGLLLSFFIKEPVKEGVSV